MSTRPFRIVVTGSRDWADSETIHRKLRFAILTALAGPAEEVVIAQGGAAGADEIARAYAAKLRLKCETFEARWAVPPRKHDPAGPERNARMLASGVDLVLAFPIGTRSTSPGTWDCIEKAARVGIPITIVPKAAP